MTMSLTRYFAPLLISIVALLIVGATPASAALEPFKGHLKNGDPNESLPCEDVIDQGQAIARYCEGGPRTISVLPPNLDDKRVVGWDNQPIDADVTVPPQGDGPWPLVVMLHGFAENKLSFETDNPSSQGLNNIGLARRGFAVLTPSARGFGASCGFGILGAGYMMSGYSFWDAILGQLACPPESWVHLDDARFEVHDTQYLTGLLVDGGIAEPNIGSVGESYGGGHTLLLAHLKNRIMPADCRLDDCTLEPWTSPLGTPMSVVGAGAIVPWSDLANGLLPNGRSIDDELEHPTATPIGVKRDSWVDTLYLSGVAAGYYAPEGCEGTEPCPDMTAWYGLINQGEPYGDEGAELAEEVTNFHSAVGIEPPKDGPAPTFIVSGWTDDLFTPIEGSRFYNRTVNDYPDVPVAFRVADVGHPRAQNKSADKAAIEVEGMAWMDYFVKGEGAEPESGVRAMTQTCPKEKPSEGPFPESGSAPNVEGLSAGEVTFNSKTPQTVDARGGWQWLAWLIDPHPMGLLIDGDPCRQTSTWQKTGVAQYELPPSSGYTMLGFPKIKARIATTGAGAVDGELAGRLWDVDPGTNKQTLVSKGIYRLDGNQRGKIVFELNGNGWRFEQGHIPKFELLGRDSPTYRPSNNEDFNVTIDSVRLKLPTVEADPTP